MPSRKTKLFTNNNTKKWIFILLGITILFWYHWNQFFLAHSEPKPTKGGIFTESVVGKLTNLSPFKEFPTLLESDLQKLIFAGLLRYDPITGQIEDALADLRISEDGKTYFCTLKKSAKFQNGDPVTKDDVIFTFEKLIQNPQFPNLHLKEAFQYVTIDVTDKETIAFRLPEKNIFFPHLLTTPIVKEKFFQDILIEQVIDPDYPFNKKPTGAGAFSLERIVPNDDGSFRIFLKANQYFYDGTPKIEQIAFYIFPNFAHLQIEKNWTSVFSGLTTTEIKKLEKNLYGEYQTREYILPRFVSIFLNLDSPTIKNPILRKALNLTINRDKTIENETGWNRIDHPFFFEGLEEKNEQDGPTARRLLRENGFWKNQKQNQSITMITSTEPPVYSRFAQKIIQEWNKELDIKIKLEILTPTELQKALKNRTYDMLLFGQDFSENFDILSLWHSSQAKKLNLSNLTRDDIDFAIDDIRASGAQSDIEALHKKLKELIPEITFATPKYELLISKKLHGFSETFGKIRAHSDRFANINKWYFEKELKWNIPEKKSKIWEFIKWIFNS